MHEGMIGPVDGRIEIPGDGPRFIEPFLIGQIEPDPFGP